MRLSATRLAKNIPAGLPEWLVERPEPAAAVDGEGEAVVPADGSDMDRKGEAGEGEGEQEAKEEAAKENEPPVGRGPPRKRGRDASPAVARKAKRAKKADAEGET